ncbi:LPXTG cell wall anchor domain-containing protein [Glycomyces sp. NPDC047369]
MPLITHLRAAAAIGLLGAIAFAAPAHAQPGVGEDEDDVPTQPFRVADTAAEAEPGDTVVPYFQFEQQWAIPDDAAVLAVGLLGPVDTMEGIVEIDAPYDNCVDRYWGGPPGATCYIAVFDDVPGQTLTVDAPIGYAVDPLAPGPFTACGCNVDVRELDADEFAAETGGLTWDPASTNLLGLTTTAPIPADNPRNGWFLLSIGEHPYDLAVADTAIEDAGETVVSVANHGPATAYNLSEGAGDYTLIGSLPEGAELVSAGGDGFLCFEPQYWDVRLGERDPADYDFVCAFGNVVPGETADLVLDVEVSGDPGADGTLEVLQPSGFTMPIPADADPGNDTARLLLDTPSLPQLPKTGASLTAVLVGAVVVIAAGVLLFVFTRRRGGANGGSEDGADVD